MSELDDEAVTPPTTEAELIGVVAALTRSVAKLTEEVRSEAKSRKNLTTWIKRGVAIAVVVVLVMGFGIWKAFDASSDAKAASRVAQANAAQTEFDRCVSGNNFRAVQRGINVGTVDYIDSLLAAFGALGPPPESLTPEQQAKAVEAATNIAATRQRQLEKNNAPELAQRECGPDPSKAVAK